MRGKMLRNSLYGITLSASIIVLGKNTVYADSLIDDNNIVVDEENPKLNNEIFGEIMIEEEIDTDFNTDTTDKKIINKEDIIEKNRTVDEEEDNLKSNEIENQEDSQTLVNGSFENVTDTTGKWTGNTPNEWSIWHPKDIEHNDYFVGVENGHLKIESLNNEYRVSVYQDLNLDNTKEYEVSFDIKTVQKKGLARARIIEMIDDKQVNLWYSEHFYGNTDWKKSINKFTPNRNANKFRLELFYERGTGTVLYDNIEIKEKINSEKIKEIIEDRIDLEMDSRYLPKNYKMDYVIKDTKVAEIKNGIIFPKHIGKTTVNIYDKNNELQKIINLSVKQSNNTKYTSQINEWIETIVGNTYYDHDNEVMRERFNEFEKAADKFIDEYKLKKFDDKYLWDDLKDLEKSQNLTSNYRRLEGIARQIMHPTSKYFKYEYAINLVKKSMEWLYINAYNETKSIIGNWWDYEIGVPRAINNTLGILNEFFTESEIKRYTKPIIHFVPNSYRFRETTGDPFDALAGNLVDMGRVRLITGALRQDEKIVTETIESLSRLFKFTDSGSGFRTDGSYIDHDNLALTGAYGNVLLDGLSQLLPTIVNSNNFANESLDTLYQFIKKSFLPLMYKGEMMDMVRGRGISRKELQSHVAGGEVLRGILRISEVVESPIKEELKSIVKTIVTQDTYYNIYKSLSSFKDIMLMQNLLTNDIPIISRKNNISIYNLMDKVSFINADKNFAFAISMYSNKTQNYESINGENKKGWYLSDGMTYLYNDDLSHYSDNYWATVNPYYLPGTTVTLEERKEKSGQVTSEKAFVGGSKLDNSSATIGMDFSNWNNSLTAKKSWFIFGNRIVSLGSNIKNNSENKTITTIENRKLRKKYPYKIELNGEKIQLSDGGSITKKVDNILLHNPNNNLNIGLKFLNSQTVSVEKESNTGNWNEINERQKDREFENQFLKIYTEHSKENNNYAYITYPNIKKDNFEKQILDKDIKILSQNEKIHAVYSQSLNQWGVVLFEDSNYKVTDDLYLKEKGIYTIRKISDNKYEISYYNPITQESYLKTEDFINNREDYQETTELGNPSEVNEMDNIKQIETSNMIVNLRNKKESKLEKDTTSYVEKTKSNNANEKENLDQDYERLPKTASIAWVNGLIGLATTIVGGSLKLSFRKK